jgi:hypothetical protein
MITPSFSPTATERVLPKLALDFTTASLDARVTLTRALNTATCVNSSGNVAVVNANLPRFDYDPTTLVCKGLLIEESRTNNFSYSEDFGNAYWSKVRSSVTTDVTNSPAGTNTADKLIEDTSTNTHLINLGSISFTSGTFYSFSVFAKAAERSQIVLLFGGTAFGSGSGSQTLFDLSNATISNIAGAVATSTITNMGNGWYRCTATLAATATASDLIQFRLATGGTVTYTGNGTSGLYIWGAQLETGAFATSYIPNLSTGTTTRNADVATMTGTNFSSWWIATNGASDIWLIPKSTSTLAYMSFDDNTANNKIVIANSTTSGQSTITSGGVLQATLTAGTITANATNKVGCSWNTNNCAATANATNPATTASATIPTVTQLRIGNNGSAYANAWIQKLFYWPQRITNNEIQAFTK